MKTALQFKQDWGIFATSEQVDKNINAPDWTDANHYKVVFSYRLKTKRPQYTTYFSQGYGIDHKPRAEDVLLCLSQDIQGLENSGSFENWADDYGYDQDSRKAEKAYRTIQKQAQDIENWLPSGAWRQFLALQEEE